MSRLLTRDDSQRPHVLELKGDWWPEAGPVSSGIAYRFAYADEVDELYELALQLHPMIAARTQRACESLRWHAGAPLPPPPPSVVTLWNAPAIAPEVTAPLDQVLTALRERAGLPVQDLATMLGVQRRQFYNLLDGGNTTTERESIIRRVAQLVDQLWRDLDGDAALVRRALLAPGVGGSMLELIGRGEHETAATRIADTVARVRRGVTAVDVPPSGRAPASTALDAVRLDERAPAPGDE